MLLSMIVQMLSSTLAGDKKLFTSGSEPDAEFLSHHKALALQESMTRTMATLRAVECEQAAIYHW